MKVPASSYRDPARWERELQRIFLRVPLLVALSCDIAEPGDYSSIDIAGRPVLVVRGDDGAARAFLNLCRHRGAKVVQPGCGSARRFTCPYHSWSYDRQGALVGVPGRDTFGELDVTGLIEFPVAERVGAVFCVLSPDADLDIDDWLGPMADALAALRLRDLHPYRSRPNWRAPTGRSPPTATSTATTWDTCTRTPSAPRPSPTATPTTFSAAPTHRLCHQGHAGLRDLPESEWSLPDAMSMVHFVFPNVSMSGGHGDSLMLSRLVPGPTPARSRTIQHQYFRQPIVGERRRPEPRSAACSTKQSSGTRTTSPGSASRPAWRRSATTTSASDATSLATSTSTAASTPWSRTTVDEPQLMNVQLKGTPT